MHLSKWKKEFMSFHATLYGLNEIYPYDDTINDYGGVKAVARLLC